MAESEILKEFNSKEGVPKLPFNPAQAILRKRFGNREVGIEVEMEGRNLPRAVQYITKTGVPWSVHEDGSLRGGLEYTLAGPIERKEVSEATEALYNAFATYPSCKINPGQRCSTHIHINIQGMRMNEIVSFMSLWYIIEDVAVSWCGEQRVGNLFCLRLSDADRMLNTIVASIKAGGFYDFPEDWRYAAMNVCAIPKFGSLEFRTLKACKTPADIVDWTNMLLQLKDKALSEYKNPLDILRSFSGLGSFGFIENITGSMAPRIIDAANKEGVDISRSCWEGLRRVQPLIYTFDWNQIIPEAYKVHVENPFEPAKKVPARGLDFEPFEARGQIRIRDLNGIERLVPMPENRIRGFNVDMVYQDEVERRQQP